MTTTRDIVTRALEHLRVVGAGETVQAADADLSVRALVSLLDSMQLEPRATVGLTQLTYTPAAGVQSFTIGPAGSVVAPQPLEIDKTSFYRAGGADAPLGVGTLQDYNAQADKAVRGLPQFVALVRGYDTATVYLFPASDGAAQLSLWVMREPLADFSDLAIEDALTLPAGMRSMLEWALADALSHDFVVQPDVAAFVRDKALAARRLYRRSNTQIKTLAMPYGVSGRASFDIQTG